MVGQGQTAKSLLCRPGQHLGRTERAIGGVAMYVEVNQGNLYTRRGSGGAPSAWVQSRRRLSTIAMTIASAGEREAETS